jgi:hypothetical protein
LSIPWQLKQKAEPTFRAVVGVTVLTAHKVRFIFHINFKDFMKAIKLSAVVVACAWGFGSVGGVWAQTNILGDKKAVPEQCTGVSAQCLDAAIAAKQAPKVVAAKAHKKAKVGGTLPVAGVDGIPEAVPGECYARIFYPEQTKTETTKVLKRAASSRLDLIPGQMADDEEQVTVREASKRLEVVPATYKTVTEEVVVRAASKRLERVPGGFEETSEQVLVSSAHSVWKRGVNITGVKTKQDANGDVLCLVEVPAVYKTVKHRVAKPDTVREIEIPEVTKTVTKTVVDTPASTREIDIPAVTKMIKVVKEVSPPKENRVDTPAEYTEVSRTQVVRPAGWEWRSVLCETNATPAKIAEIQGALKKKGVAVDATADLKGTLTALNDFRRSQNIRVDNYITVDSLKALGVGAK